ncbi:MAG: type II toxin-antitoxin system Phd/YefM family antitoxin [Kiritimatiellae bacterium]|nr:type II toxin-antitoxin system Phd/YefM family antitoxin [Kiritimatiellia bacterium]
MEATASSIGLFDAKTHFSQIVDDLLNGRRGPVSILRRGKPAAVVVPVGWYRERAGGASGIRLGLAKGKYRIPRDIDAGNRDVLALFGGGRP